MCSYRPFLYNCTILTIAVNALVHVAPVDLAGRCRTAIVALRLREAGYIEGCEHMHFEMLALFDFILQYLDYHVAGQRQFFYELIVLRRGLLKKYSV